MKTTRPVSTLVVAIALAAAAPTTRAQWTVTNLHPPDPPGEQDPWAASAVFGGSATHQVGQVMPGGGAPLGGSGSGFAGLWNGTAGSWVNLHPVDGFWRGSIARGVADNQQVGQVFYSSCCAPHTLQQAGLWSGTAESFVLLAGSPSSALATSGMNQVGWVSGHASLWSGTPESKVDLHPTGATSSQAAAISGGQQAGSAVVGGVQHAGLWHGTAESWVDLHPAGAASSVAVGTNGIQQVGDAVVGGQKRAGLWSGSAASWIDLNPIEATESSASGVFGDWQAGFASFNDGPHASLWNGTAESWEDLSLALTGSWIETFATGIWSNGSTLSVTGYGRNFDTGRYEALLWTRPVPEPSALALLGLGRLIASRRRRPRGHCSRLDI